jgi:hypothetical protein
LIFLYSLRGGDKVYYGEYNSLQMLEYQKGDNIYYYKVSSSPVSYMGLFFSDQIVNSSEFENIEKSLLISGFVKL